MNTLTRRRATLLALLVTLLWSTSWVLIKLGLRQSLPPLTFAGLRYMLACLCLLPLVLFNRKERSQLARLSRADWAWLVALGLVYYALTQGTQYLSLNYLPAALVSLLLNLTPIVVALGGLLLLGERPARVQWLGLLVTLAGVGVYFYTASLPESGWLGLGVALLCLLANAASAVMGPMQATRRPGGRASGPPRISRKCFTVEGLVKVTTSALPFAKIRSSSSRVLSERTVR